MPASEELLPSTAFKEALEWGGEGGGFGAHQGVKETGLAVRGVIRPHMSLGSGFPHLASFHNSQSLPISSISQQEFIPPPSPPTAGYLVSD